MTDLLEQVSVRPRLRRSWVAGVVAVLLVLTAVAAFLVRREDGPPYAFTDLNASVTLEVVPDPATTQRLTALTQAGLLLTPAGEQQRPLLVGQLAFTPSLLTDRAAALSLLITDRRTGATFGRPSASGPSADDPIALGWEGIFGLLHEKFDWLAGTADVQTSGGFTNNNISIGLPAASPVTFAVPLPAGASLADVDVTLVLTDGETIFWAERVSDRA